MTIGRGRRYTSPTWTSLVEHVLNKTDDFLNYAMLMKATGGSISQISAACHHLRNVRAIDVIVEKDGVGWWYATPETDQRSRTIEERVEHTKNRKRGYKSKKRSAIKRGSV